MIISDFLAAGVDVAAINNDLPEDIRVFAVKNVTKGFNAKQTCDARSYSYTLPTYIFTKDDEQVSETSFRLSSERFQELNKILRKYVGTKNYHNFTIKKEPQDPSANRFMMSFKCDEPYVPDNTEVEFARLKVTGQSFMLHQIRKMVGLVIAIMRGYVDADIIKRAVQDEKMITPQAPGLGLVLDNVHYTRYNERYGGEGGTHETLNFDDEEEVIEAFFRKHIMSNIVETELRETPMRDWVGRLRKHEYDPVKARENWAAQNKEDDEKDAEDSD